MFDWLIKLLRKKFGKKAKPVVSVPDVVTTTPPVVVPAGPRLGDPFVEDFSDLDAWIVSNWKAPGIGTFATSNVYLAEGMLCLELFQTSNTTVGGEVATKRKFGYGIYEFDVRASSTSATAMGQGSPVSGSITGCFNYGPNSTTEIDIEVEGNERSPYVQLTSWIGEGKPNEHNLHRPKVGPHAEFKRYKFIWTRDSIEYYVDDLIVARHTKVVPVLPAPFMFNHWGTNSRDWGGVDSPGVKRFMWIRSFKHTPFLD